MRLAINRKASVWHFNPIPSAKIEKFPILPKHPEKWSLFPPISIVDCSLGVGAVFGEQTWVTRTFLVASGPPEEQKHSLGHNICGIFRHFLPLTGHRKFRCSMHDLWTCLFPFEKLAKKKRTKLTFFCFLQARLATFVCTSGEEFGPLFFGGENFEAWFFRWTSFVVAGRN